MFRSWRRRRDRIDLCQMARAMMVNAEIAHNAGQAFMAYEFVVLAEALASQAVTDRIREFHAGE